jgi:hypothetical protein
MELTVTKIYSAPKLPAIMPSFRNSGLDGFVTSDPQFLQKKEELELERFFDKYL